VKPGKDLDYDPHLDPQLIWAGKKEHASFEVPNQRAGSTCPRIGQHEAGTAA
jgi:hypothetical protein